MQDYATLIQSIASLLWPIFAFTALFMFRVQIADLATRLKKGKIFGQEIELGESLDKLSKAAESAQTEVASLPDILQTNQSAKDRSDEQDVVRRIVSEAAQSPKAALINLASELERLAQEVLATTGHLKGRKFVPLQQSIGELHQKYGLPSHVPSSLKHFWEVRNRLIHGGEGTDEDILRAIDSGITILKALQAMPREIHIIYKTNVPIFSDAELKTPITSAHGVILETLSSDGVSKFLRIMPTTQTHFQVGKQVSWEWNGKFVLGPAWYRDSETGEVKQAWVGSTEFIGRHLDDLNDRHP